MKNIFILSYISTFLWILPIFKQYKGGFFLIFFLMGICDPISMVMYFVFRVSSPFTFIIYTSLLIVFILYYSKKITYIKIGAIAIITIILLSFKLKIVGYNLIVLNSVLLYLYIEMFVKDTFEIGKMNLYYTMLVFYQISVVLKFVVNAPHTQSSAYKFVITVAFELIFALYFTFFNLKNSPVISLTAKKI